jgi:hypothetical protein
MIIKTQKYNKIQITKLLNTLNLNFIIFNTQLIFTHQINNNTLKLITKLLNKHYLKYKILNK